ncbi:MAG TPA: CHAD domain-containing protein [Steroidobacteraceae bacterium]
MKPITPDGDPAGRVKHTARRRIEKALRILRKQRIDDEDVHTARKALKKARATLRLLRPGLKCTIYRRSNAALRDAARPLGAVRDARVLSDTLNDLLVIHQAGARALQLDGLKQRIRRQHSRARREFIDDPHVLAHSRRLLQRSRTQLHASKLHENDWTLLGQGLRKVYAQGRAALRQARKRQTPAALHEWRKQVKHLRYALEVLSPIWPEMLGKLVEQMHELSDHLGDSHDLTLLRETAIANGHYLDDPVTLDTLLGLIAEQQGKLQAQAALLGARVFEEKPRTFATRFGQYWRQWCASPVFPPARMGDNAKAAKAPKTN